MIKIAICDDDKKVCSQIEQSILEYNKNYGYDLECDVFYSAISLFEYMKKGNEYDLIFLDIEIPELSGLELSENIRRIMDDYKTKIIFVSGKESYYKELFDVQPLHFLLKPITAEKIFKDLELAIKLTNKAERFFEYTVKRNKYKIPLKEILYFTTENRKVKAITKEDEATFYGSIELVWKQLENTKFIRIHKSYIVNYEYITQLSSSTLTMSDGTVFQISRAYKDSLKEKQILFEKEVLK